MNRIEYYYNKFCDIAKRNNGIVLSNMSDYKTAHTKLNIKCIDNHIFSITLNVLNNNHWCSLCKSYKTERYTRACLELLTNKKFIKIRPNWLKNKNNNNLELDMYNEELKLAIEYNGIQHYKFVSFFHRTEEKFQERLEYDKCKERLCKENNINLIIVKYDVLDIRTYLRDELIKLNIPINPEAMDANIIVKNELPDKVKDIVTKKNGRLITESFNFRTDIIELECDKKHIWKTRVSSIIEDSWCIYCGYVVTNETKESITKSMKKFCASENGKKIKAQSHLKRSNTMKEERDKIRENITHKICRGFCGLDLSIDNFCKKNDAKDGYQTYCLKCINQRKNELRKN
jgi:hypothetical protein